ncbi:MAG: rhomboid family intramembrane serine protease [Crocinitomicaceae bacterium]|nr:rhomboid family intramembrane serine protease [Crocinitomicaceae bacterium]
MNFFTVVVKIKLKNWRLAYFKGEITDKEKILDALLASVLFLSVCWALFAMDEYLGYHLRTYGMRPRTTEGLFGIVSMHFFHGDIHHIAQNSMAFLVMNSLLFYFYRKISIPVFLWLMFSSGVMLWLVGRPVNHIGASMLIYGEFAFLFVSGIIRKNPLLLRAALVVAFYYGSLIWYIFPVDTTISWEGHLCGFICGIALSVIFRNSGPQPPVYRFETEPVPDENHPYWMTPEQLHQWEQEQQQIAKEKTEKE